MLRIFRLRLCALFFALYLLSCKERSLPAVNPDLFIEPDSIAFLSWHGTNDQRSSAIAIILKALADKLEIETELFSHGVIQAIESFSLYLDRDAEIAAIGQVRSNIDLIQRLGSISGFDNISDSDNNDKILRYNLASSNLTSSDLIARLGVKEIYILQSSTLIFITSSIPKLQKLIAARNSASYRTILDLSSVRRTAPNSNPPNYNVVFIDFKRLRAFATLSLNPFSNLVLEESEKLNIDLTFSQKWSNYLSELNLQKISCKQNYAERDQTNLPNITLQITPDIIKFWLKRALTEVPSDRAAYLHSRLAIIRDLNGFEITVTPSNFDLALMYKQSSDSETTNFKLEQLRSLFSDMLRKAEWIEFKPKNASAFYQLNALPTIKFWQQKDRSLIKFQVSTELIESLNTKSVAPNQSITANRDNPAQVMAHICLTLPMTEPEFSGQIAIDINSSNRMLSLTFNRE